MPFEPPRLNISPGNRDLYPLLWDPVANQYRPADEGLTTEDCNEFFRRHPDCPRSAAKHIDIYMRTHGLPKDLYGLEQSWMGIKAAWEVEADKQQRYIEGSILKDLVKENNTQMIFDGLETERCE